MVKNILTTRGLLGMAMLLIAANSHAQTTSANIGQSTANLDSTFVVQTNATETYNLGNHPGAGPYQSADIYLCKGATLTYDYGIGTSNEATFFLEDRATLIFTPMSSGTIARFYMKGFATLQVPAGSTLYGTMKRESTVNLTGVTTSFFSDSVFSAISFVFPGWANPCNLPSSIATQGDASTQYFYLTQHANSGKLILAHNVAEPSNLCIYNLQGQLLVNRVINPGDKCIDANFEGGLHCYRVTAQDGTCIASGKFLQE
jgi:hypothetical protein